MQRTRHASSLNDRSRRPRADATRGGATAASAPHEPPDGDRPSKDAPDDDVPPAAFWLGAAGVAPFLALSPPAAPLLPAALAAAAPALHVGYGVAIASFLGAVHWGAAVGGADFSPRRGASGPSSLPRHSPAAVAAAAKYPYAWSVAPCLLTWPAVALDPSAGATLAAATLSTAAAVDAWAAGRGWLPAWYPRLRLPLTAAAVVGLGARAVGG